MTDLSSYKPLIRKADDGISTFPFPAHDNAYHTTPFVQKSGDTMTGIFTNTAHINTDKLNNQIDTQTIISFANGNTTFPTTGTSGVFFPVQAPTVSAPGYIMGGLYYDTTLKKLRVGGATAWETVTST